MKESSAGRFTGTFTLRPVGQKRYLCFWTRSLYRFENDIDNPLTYHCPNGTSIRPRDGMTTDMGTVPRIARIFISKDRYLKSYCIHDSGYDEGGFRVARYGSGAYRLIRVDRLVVDQQLRECIEAQGGDRVTRNTIYACVRAGGMALWNKRHKGVEPCHK